MARAKANDHFEKRNNILAQASTLFVAEGFSRASMTQLAKACDISKSNLYHYYTDKESILFELLDEHMDELLDSIRDVSRQAEQSNANRLQALISGLLHNYQNADHKHRILLNDLQVLPQEQQDIIRFKEREIVQYFKNAILLAHPQYAGNPRLLSAAAMSVLGAINWAFTWFRADKGLGVDDYADFLANTFAQGFNHYDGQ